MSTTSDTQAREGVALPTAQTIPQVLDAAAARGATITLVDHRLDATPLPCTALARGARRAARRLRELGVAPGDRVCLVSSTSVDFLVSLFGIWRAGAVPVVMPLPRNANALAGFAEDLRRRTRTADASAVVVADLFVELAPWLEQLPERVVRCGELSAAGEEIDEPVPADGDALAHLQFTSGTTATPRAVTLRHRQVIGHSKAVWRSARIRIDRFVFVSWLPWYHDMGIVTGVGTLAIGGHLVLQPPEQFLQRPGSWMEAVDRFRGTATSAPNFAYALAARALERVERPLDLSCLVVAGNGAEAIDLAAMHRFTSAAARHGLREEAVCPMYGLAEATLAVTMSRATEAPAVDVVSRTLLGQTGEAVEIDASDPDARSIAICGVPIPDLALEIRDAFGKPLGERHVGEIHVSGLWITDGFWRDPEATRAAIVDGWLRTGDLGYLVDGQLVVCGRVKDMVIAAGRNLYPEDYEQASRQVTGVRPVVAAFAIPETERMTLVAEAEQDVHDAGELAERIFGHLHAVLAHPPHEVVVLPRGEIPRTSSGKIQRHAVRNGIADESLMVLARTGR